MKKNVLSLFAVAALMVSYMTVKAQESIYMIPAGESITMDGVADEAVWGMAMSYPIDQAFVDDFAPADAADCSATWKAVHDGTNIYVLVEVTDDVNDPGPGSSAWTHDKVEIYFDVNAELADGLGASGGMDTGHKQFIAQAEHDLAEGEEDALGSNNELVVTGTNYVLEFSVPFGVLTDADGVGMSTDQVVGFDITVIDNDSGVDGEHGRISWKNNGTGCGENWTCMDDAGQIKLVNDELPVSSQTISAIQVQMFPNPASDVVTFTNATQVSIYNTLGAEVINAVNNNNTNLTVDVSALNTGVYMVVVDQKAATKLIIE